MWINGDDRRCAPRLRLALKCAFAGSKVVTTFTAGHVSEKCLSVRTPADFTTQLSGRQTLASGKAKTQI